MLEKLRIRFCTLKGILYLIWREYIKKDNVVGYKLIRCPICENITLDSFWVCPRCGWIHEDFCTDNVFAGIDSNDGKSIVEYKAEYQRKIGMISD